MANSVDPDQTAPIGAVCSGSMLFAYILNSFVMIGNYLQQTTSADNIFRCIFFLGALRVKFNSLHAYLSPTDFFLQNIFFSKILSGLPSESQTFWIQIRSDIMSDLVWVQIVCKLKVISR